MHVKFEGGVFFFSSRFRFQFTSISPQKYCQFLYNLIYNEEDNDDEKEAINGLSECKGMSFF